MLPRSLPPRLSRLSPPYDRCFSSQSATKREREGESGTIQCTGVENKLKATATGMRGRVWERGGGEKLTEKQRRKATVVVESRGKRRGNLWERVATGLKGRVYCW